MKHAYVLLAEGFEEIEALAPVDVLRRGGVQVTTVGLAGKRVPGGHGIVVEADMDGTDFALPQDATLVMLPGGGLGTENLGKSGMVAAVLAQAAQRGIFIAAICAAPTVLHKAGLLAGKRATAFPAMQAQLTQARVTGAAVEVDGNIITGRSAGVALAFSHALLAALEGRAKADEVLASMYPEMLQGQ